MLTTWLWGIHCGGCGSLMLRCFVDQVRPLTDVVATLHCMPSAVLLAVVLLYGLCRCWLMHDHT